MASGSEMSSSYTVQNWINDADVVVTVWKRISDGTEFSSLKEILEEQDKTDAEDALRAVDKSEELQIRANTHKEIHKLRRSANIVEEFTTIINRFRGGVSDSDLIPPKPIPNSRPDVRSMLPNTGR